MTGVETIPTVEGAPQAAEGHAPHTHSLSADYRELMKPRITLLVLITTLGAMLWAAEGLPPLVILVATLFGMGCASGGAAAWNHVLDRDIDVLMRRTANRPVAAGRISPRAAAIFGTLLIAAGGAAILVTSNPLAAGLAVGGALFYIVIYTMILKRRTAQNIVIGGAAGAIAPLVGWAAVTGDVGLGAWLMFAIIFLWTPPHTWALAILIKDEYARAGVPMLPVVATARSTDLQILAYAVILTTVSVLALPAGLLGVPYTVAAALLGARFVQLSVRLLRDHTNDNAKRLFLYSLLYLALLFAAIGVDRVIAALV